MVVVKEREHMNKSRGGGVKSSENSATDNRDNYCTQTDKMMVQTRYHFGALLSSFTYLSISSFFSHCSSYHP